MAKAQWCGSYDAAQLLLDRCLRRDGSLFSESPDRPIWTADLAAELDGRVGSPDTSEASFTEKLDRQLDGLDAEAIQLAAELLYVELLGENDTGGDIKEEHVNHVLGLVPGTTPMAENIRQALHAGGPRPAAHVWDALRGRRRVDAHAAGVDGASRHRDDAALRRLRAEYPRGRADRGRVRPGLPRSLAPCAVAPPCRRIDVSKPNAGPGYERVVQVESASVTEPWTQSIELHWGPELRFYEERVALLRALEDRGSLHAFRVGESFVDARLFDDQCMLSVQQDRMELQMLAPSVDEEKAWDTVALVLACIQPSHPHLVVASFQHLVPLPLDFDEAVSRGQERILQPYTPPGDITLGDWAVLSDIHVDGDPERFGTVEFGIVRAHEVPRRLSRFAGRVGGRRRVGPEHWDATHFEDVSLFADSWWRREVSEPTNLRASARAYSSDCRRRSSILVEDLHTRLSMDEDGNNMEAS
jgi:hypothetical protein